MNAVKKFLRRIFELDTAQDIQRHIDKFNEDMHATKTMLNHEDDWFLNACKEGEEEGKKKCYPE